MKIYESVILEAWENDKGIDKVDENSAGKPIIEELTKAVEELLKPLSVTLKAQHDDPEVIHDKAYRDCFLILGLCKITQFHKAQHLLTILEFVLDFGREKQDFNQYSMVYLVDLLSETVHKILKEFIDSGQSEYDVTDIVEECRTYLSEPLQSVIEEFEQLKIEKLAQSEASAAIITEGRSLTAVPETEAPTAQPEDANEKSGAENRQRPTDLSDEQEILNIPADRLDFVSDFCEEARDNLGQMSLSLIELEDSESPGELINSIFRAVHTVKGGARLLEIRKIEALAHEMEGLLDTAREGKIKLNASHIDALMDGYKALEQMIDEVIDGGPISTKIVTIVDSLYGDIPSETDTQNNKQEEESVTADTKLVAEGTKEQRKVPETPEPQSARSQLLSEETIRVPTEKLDDVLNTATEVFITQIRLQNDMDALGSAVQHLDKLLVSTKLSELLSASARLRQSIGSLDEFLVFLPSNASGFDCHQKMTLNSLTREIGETARQGIFDEVEAIPEELRLSVLRVNKIREQLEKNIESLEGLSGRLQSGAMNFRMVPVSQLFNRFPAQLREMARKVGKKARLTLSGADTELDKVLINQLADPLVHIMRNSLDHGIEPTEERTELGKAETGEIKLSAYYQGSHTVIEIADDGRGINTERVLERSIERGLVTRDRADQLLPREIMEFIFEPGFSTAEQVTELSGRGVGMDVVKTAINQVQGALSVDSEPGAGTTIWLRLPLTLAVVGILLVEENGQQVAFPVLNVVEILTIQRNELRIVGENSVVNYRGKTVPITTLSKLLDFSASAFRNEQLSLVVVSDGERQTGVLVDAVLGRQDVLIKQLGSLVKKVPLVMGCTILSDRRLVLILNVWEITANSQTFKINTNLRSLKNTRSLLNEESAANNSDQSRREAHPILIVDDSALQRNRISTILTRAGYVVETASDGHDALTKSQNKNYSAFCVDIVMPLMDGYEFVERIRQSSQYKTSPIFMISGRNIEDESEQRRFRSLSITGFFEKPVDPELLIESIDKSLNIDSSFDDNEIKVENLETVE